MSVKFNELSNAIRFLSVDAVQKANSGHPGMPMGMADVATVLFKYHLRFNPKNPNWINRDRFILSAGHGSMLLYSLLYLTGYESISIDDIKKSFTGITTAREYKLDNGGITVHVSIPLERNNLKKEVLLLSTNEGDIGRIIIEERLEALNEVKDAPEPLNVVAVTIPAK